LSFITPLNKTILARKRATETNKNNDSNSKRGSLAVGRHPA